MTLLSPDERLARDLWESVSRADLTRVSSLLSEGADPNHPLFWSPEWTNKSHPWSYPPLHYACFYGYIGLSIVKALVEAGADCERDAGEHHDRPVHAACRSRDDVVEVMQFLVEDKACSLVVKNGEDKTPSALGIGFHDCKVALFLINSGYIDEREKAKLLCEACHYGKIDIVKELVKKHKIDPNVVTNDGGESPLDKALEGCDDFHCCQVALYLINCGCGVDKEKARLMCKACQYGKNDIFKKLVEKYKIDPTVIKDRDNRTLLDIANSSVHVSASEMALHLINRGCGGDEEKAKLLCRACFFGQIDIVKELVEKHKIDPSVARDEGDSPLEATNIYKQELSCHAALYLINRGCGGDEEKARLLFKASYWAEIDIVKELVEKHKIDPNNLSNDDDLTPLDVASESKRYHVDEHSRTIMTDYLKSLQPATALCHI